MPKAVRGPAAVVLGGPSGQSSQPSVPLDGSNAGSRRAWLLGASGTAALSVWLYVISVHANSAVVTSDGATVVLQGKSVASGNFVLQGWNLSFDS